MLEDSQLEKHPFIWNGIGLDELCIKPNGNTLHSKHLLSFLGNTASMNVISIEIEIYMYLAFSLSIHSLADT